MKKILLLAAGGILLLTACKPTEHNYRNAYDKAYEAAQRKAAEMSVSTDGAVLETFDGPRVEIVEGDTLYVSPVTVSGFETDGEKSRAGKIGIAVARYSMPTNARRHMADLAGKYPGASMATDGDDNYYVLIDRVASIPEAAAPLRGFRKANPDYPYIGLGGKALILVLRD